MMSPYAARVAIVAAVVSLITLAALHILKPDLHPSRTMISQYALGQYGRGMALCFAAFGVASGSLAVAMVPHVRSLGGRVGIALLLTAAVGLVMAARFPMDPVSTPPAQMSRSGRMHGVAFLLGVPSMVLAVLVLSLALGSQGSNAGWLLMAVAAVIWISLIIMIGIMLMVGPGKPPDPNGPERFVGLPNRSLMVAYAVWLMVAAWPLARG
jgi:Protein of unknown function (DUF998)